MCNIHGILIYRWNPENEGILSTSEFITLFLKVHALLHLSTDILPCSTYVRLLSTSLTAHVATESFTSINLIQVSGFSRIHHLFDAILSHLTLKI